MAERIFIGVRALFVVLLALFITLLAVPTQMRSYAWTPPAAPELEGPFERNELLEHAELLSPGQLRGPEDIAIDEVGRIYSGTSDGKIIRLLPGVPLEIFAVTGGRPLGMAFGPDGDLFVADVVKGLLRVSPAGEVETLATECEGVPFVFLNEVAVSKDGNTLYLTDSSSRWGFHEEVNDILEQSPSGRLMRFDLATLTSTVLMRGLSFANGIALSPDESFLLVSETGRYRVTRMWLTGERRNLPETFADNLPGFPDNLSVSPRGTFWVALYSVRKPLLDFVHPFPFVKDCIAGLPSALQPHAIPYGLVFEMDASGRVLRSFHDPSGARMKEISSVVESRGVLYIGSLSGTAIGRFSP